MTTEIISWNGFLVKVLILKKSIEIGGDDKISDAFLHFS